MAGTQGRSRAAVALALAAGVLLAALAVRDRSQSRAAPSGEAGVTATPAAARVAYRLEPAGRPAVGVSLEVAASPAARQRGLMGRTSVPRGTGMVFLMPSDTTTRFWMKDTLVPLSIAFMAADGRVIDVVEMPPCTADPCPTYGPERPYRYAVELAAGAFARAGIHPGDRVVPADPASLPRAS